jgi:dedicator of cytokinesis protein 1
MTLIPESELRKATIPIFFDMMQCEFYSSRFESESYGDTKRDSSHVKGNFNEFENEMIAKLDILVEGGKGDDDYRNLFHDIMIDHCSQHASMKEMGIKFVKTVTRLMERLLEYRCIITDENKENRMSCTVSLLVSISFLNRVGFNSTFLPNEGLLRRNQPQRNVHSLSEQTLRPAFGMR